MIRVLLFDFYGVFTPDSYNAWLKENGLKREGIFAELINDFDRNRITEKDFLHRLAQSLGRQVTREEIHTEHPALDDRLVDLVRELKSAYTIGLLSNAPIRLRTKLDNLQLTPLFDTILISSEIGYTKPHREAFQAAIAAFKVPAQDILFIDDNPQNIEAATKSGMKAVHYTDPDALRAALKAQHIL